MNELSKTGMELLESMLNWALAIDSRTIHPRQYTTHADSDCLTLVATIALLHQFINSLNPVPNPADVSKD